MLRIESFEALMEEMKFSLVDESLARKDYDRLTNSYYGKSCNPLIFCENLLIIGVRSGLEFLIAKSVNSNAVVHIVESNKSLLEKINKLNIANVTAFSSFKEYISSVKSQKYDYVRIDRVNFNLDLVAQLYSKHNILSICGELKEADCKPLTLYRLSRNSCDSFFFNIKDKNYNVAGARKCIEQPEVSVVVAAYGVENYLDECVSSIVHQTLKNIEILIVDDGSIDGTGKKADEWQKRFPDIVRVIHKENGGCASARLEGMREAKGEYVAFVDGDDWVEQPMYEDLFESAALHNSEIA